MFRVICVVIGYTVGCVQVSYVIGKLVGRIDIRQHGSGNAGATNVVRVLGMKAGMAAFVFDVLKGIVSYILCSVLFDGGGSFTGGSNGLLPGLYAGLGAVLGHDFPFFLRFKGGKGISSTLGIMLCADWKLAILNYICGFFVVYATKFISAASLFLTLFFPVLLAVFKYPFEAVAVCAVLALLALIQHRGNIARLIKGNERKFTFGK